MIPIIAPIVAYPISDCVSQIYHCVPRNASPALPLQTATHHSRSSQSALNAIQKATEMILVQYVQFTTLRRISISLAMNTGTNPCTKCPTLSQLLRDCPKQSRIQSKSGTSAYVQCPPTQRMIAWMRMSVQRKYVSGNFLYVTSKIMSQITAGNTSSIHVKQSCGCIPETMNTTRNIDKRSTWQSIEVGDQPSKRMVKILLFLIPLLPIRCESDSPSKKPSHNP